MKFKIVSLLISALVVHSDQISISTTVSSPNENGFLVHTVKSPYQSNQTKIRVLLPDQMEKDRRYPVLYALPVEANEEKRYGDGLLEIRKQNLHNRYGIICIGPTFSQLPWYADHPSKLMISQETYFVRVVVPFIERNYPALTKKEGRLLIGFSKSGWGAWSLLLRHPDLFGKAAAWDAPLMMEKPDHYGMAPIFGSQKNFEQYQITRLLKNYSHPKGQLTTLILTGFGNFRKHHLSAYKLLNQLHIPVIYRDGPKRKHTWDSGWLGETVHLMFDPSQGSD